MAYQHTAIDSRIVPSSFSNLVAELACVTRPWSALQEAWPHVYIYIYIYIYIYLYTYIYIYIYIYMLEAVERFLASPSAGDGGLLCESASLHILCCP